MDYSIYRKRKIGNIVLYCIFAIFMIIALYNKKNMHVDEAFSYGLANNNDGTVMSIEDGVTYYPSNDPWIDYMTVDSEHCFDYVNVWENQALDVHPPLYYMILHTICSFFPNSFSLWFAGLINIVFAIGTLFFMRRLIILLTENKLINWLVSIAFICSAGILSSVTFLRMYILAMFWVTAFTYLIIKQIGEKNTARTYLFIMGITLGGALTHYYCIVYIIFCSIAYGCYLLYSRDWKATGWFCLTQGIAALASIVIFPAMIGHVLSSGRGNQSVSNFVDNSLIVSLERMRKYFNIVDTQLFGGLFIYIFFILILFLLITPKDTFKRLMLERKITVIRYLCIIISVVLYFVLISKIAVYFTDRYMVPIYAVLFAVVFCGIYECIHMLERRQYVYLFSILMVIMNVNSWRNINWQYLYKDSEALIENASDYSNVDCLYIYDATWKLNSSYYEVSKYHSVTFVKNDKLDLLTNLGGIEQKYHLIVMTTGEDEEILEDIISVFPELDTYDYLGGYAYSNTYYVHSLQ